jgi:error-prone DNA polymerase
VNLVVWLKVWERFHRIARRASALLVSGKLQKQDSVIHLIVERMEDLSLEVVEIGPVSRDFR